MPIHSGFYVNSNYTNQQVYCGFGNSSVDELSPVLPAAPFPSYSSSLAANFDDGSSDDQRFLFKQNTPRKRNSLNIGNNLSVVDYDQTKIFNFDIDCES